MRLLKDIDGPFSHEGLPLVSVMSEPPAGLAGGFGSCRFYGGLCNIAPSQLSSEVIIDFRYGLKCDAEGLGGFGRSPV